MSYRSHFRGLVNGCITDNGEESQNGTLFCFTGNFVPYETKNAPRDRTAADGKMPLARPAAGGKSRRRDSIFTSRRGGEGKDKEILRNFFTLFPDFEL